MVVSKVRERWGILVNGEWIEDRPTMTVSHPYDGRPFAEVAIATDADVNRALDAAVAGAAAMANLAGHERATILERAAELVDSAAGELSELILLEQGKTRLEASREASRCGPLLRLCAAEARRLSGEVLPLDGSPGGEHKLGLAIRVPCGVVVAITPFNYPALLVLHKVAPALAAGNAVILKPSSSTPITALRISELLLEAGLPAAALQCLVGAGSVVGERLCADPRVRVITFTGSRESGHAIAKSGAGRRLSLELGANCPTIVLDDADLELAAANLTAGAYANAGQVCISAQRVIATPRIVDDLVGALAARAEAITAGDPQSEHSDIGPLINEHEAKRVEATITQAVSRGARLAAGGQRDRSTYQPTVVADVVLDSDLFREELFGPALAVTAAADFAEAVKMSNLGAYGLAAGIFTRDIDRALRFVREAQVGVVHINNSPLWRADAMPYGGVKDSGFGREGPRYAIEGMTEIKTVVFHESATRTR